MTDSPPLLEELLQQAIERFWETIPAVWSQILERQRQLAVEYFDITFEQFHVLRHVRKVTTSISDLAEARHISRPANSQAVDVLVKKGLLLRDEDRIDRRYVRLELTQDGAALVEAVFKSNRQWMQQKMASLSADEVQCILRGLDALKKTFDQPPG